MAELTRSQVFVRAVVVVGSAFSLVAGLWALVAPRAFYDGIALFAPYNRHFLHDVGAFQTGLGAMLLLAMVWKDGLSAALTGFAVASVLHAAAHIVDAGIGGRPTDPIGLSVVAVVVVAAAVVQVRSGRGPRS